MLGFMVEQISITTYLFLSYGWIFTYYLSYAILSSGGVYIYTYLSYAILSYGSTHTDPKYMLFDGDPNLDQSLVNLSYIFLGIRK